METKLIEKIQKLMRLATSPNEHEASLAMAKAEEIMRKHNLEMKDIIEDKDESNINQVTVEAGGRVPQWKVMLLSSMASCFDCAVLRSRDFDENWKQVMDYKVIGFRADIEVVFHFYHYLIEALGKRAKAEVKGRKNINTFCIYATYEVINRLQTLYKKTTETSTCTALVVQKKAQVNKYMEQFGSKKHTISPNATGDASAARKGREAGRTVPLNRPIDGTSNTALR